MKALLFSDPHFTDNPQEEYRWRIFPFLSEKIQKHKVDFVCCLGDLTDRKDRHTKELLNRLTYEVNLIASIVPFWILSGNHDKPIKGCYYWDFLNDYPNVRYLINPTLDSDVYFLPFSNNPDEEWAKLSDLNNAKMYFIHQTVTGALIEGDRKIDHGVSVDVLPKNKPIYSGDVHRPQQCGNIVYIGCPHPVRYSESWDNRVLLIDTKDTAWNYLELPTNYIRRAILDIRSSKDLDSLNYVEGDQLRIRFHLSGENIADWPEEEAQIRTWAHTKKLFLASVEPILEGSGVQAKTEAEVEKIEIMPPEEVVRFFCKTEQLSDDVLNMGLEILKQSRG